MAEHGILFSPPMVRALLDGPAPEGPVAPAGRAPRARLEVV